MMAAIYKAVLCFLRRHSQNDKRNAAIAGFLSAIAIVIDTKDRRKFISLIIFGRSLVIKLCQTCNQFILGHITNPALEL
jgi:hypothetical protein